MIVKFKEYLESKLKESGYKGKIYTTLKELSIAQAPNVAGILFQKEKFEKNRSKNIVTLANDSKVVRIKTLDRFTWLSVVIGDISEENIEQIFSVFLANLDTEIDDANQNYVDIEVGESDWIEKDDSVLKSKIAVQVLIKFTSCIYKDKPMIAINEIQVQEERSS